MQKEGCIKVAFVGAGYMTKEHIRAFGSIPGVVLKGIHSRTDERAEELAREFGVEYVLDSIDALYEITKANLVVISVPELSTYSVCKEAFKYPWTILVEKPIGFDLEDAEKINDLAEDSRAKVFVALNRRHYGSTRAVIHELQSECDSRRFVEIIDQEDQLSALNAGQPQIVVNNWMYANSIHMIDYFNIFCRGNLVGVKNIISWNPAQPFLVCAKVEYDSGDTGIYRCVWNAPGPWSVTVTTQNKRWEMRPLEVAHSQKYGARVSLKLPESEIDSIYKPGLRLQAEQAVRAALGKDASLCNMAESMQLMRLISKIYQVGKYD